VIGSGETFMGVGVKHYSKNLFATTFRVNISIGNESTSWGPLAQAREYENVDNGLPVGVSNKKLFIAAVPVPQSHIY
jgi:hypothetical protein